MNESIEILTGALDFVNRQPCRCMSVAQLGERDYCDRCNAVRAIKQASAAIALMRGQSWQPIETAPKDGGDFLVYLPNERKKIQTAWKTANGIMAIGGVFSFDISEPTHWQPLPAPPATKQERDDA